MQDARFFASWLFIFCRYEARRRKWRVIWALVAFIRALVTKDVIPWTQWPSLSSLKLNMDRIRTWSFAYWSDALNLLSSALVEMKGRTKEYMHWKVFVEALWCTIWFWACRSKSARAKLTSLSGGKWVSPHSCKWEGRTGSPWEGPGMLALWMLEPFFALVKVLGTKSWGKPDSL